MLQDLLDDSRRRVARGFLDHGIDLAYGQGADASFESAREKAKSGNPFPLIAAQWPEAFVITDPTEATFFEGEIGNPDNPCLRLDPWSREVLRAAFDVTVGEIAMKGCTGAGKGFTAAIVANLLFDVFDPCRINVTSETFRHASQNLFGEISVWREKMASPGPGTLLSTELGDTKRHYISVLNPSPHGRGEAFSGMHSEMTVYFFDEASGIPETHYTNCLKNARKVFALSNPRITEGWFRDLYRPMRGEGTKEEQNERENTTGYCQGRIGRRLCATIPGDACANVRFARIKNPVAPRRGITVGDRQYGPSERLDDADFEQVKALVPRQIDLEQYQSILDTSKEPWEIECYAHARFPTEDPIRQVILSSWLARHTEHWKRIHQSLEVTCFGLDVARSKSGDDSVLVAGGLNGIKKIHRWKDDDNMRHVKRIITTASEEYGVDLREGNIPVCIDYAGGYGAGVGDRLTELGVWVMKFQPAGRATVEPGVYVNSRAEWYMLLSRRLDPSDNWQSHAWALPDDSMLLEELSSPVKYLTRGGTAWQIEAKDEIRKRIGRSPDSSDAVVCLYRAVFERYQLLKLLHNRVGDILIDADGSKPERDPGALHDPHEPRTDDMTQEDEDARGGAQDEPPVSMTEGDFGDPSADILADFEAYLGADDDDDASGDTLSEYLTSDDW